MVKARQYKNLLPYTDYLKYKVCCLYHACGTWQATGQADHVSNFILSLR